MYDDFEFGMNDDEDLGAGNGQVSRSDIGEGSSAGYETKLCAQKGKVGGADNAIDLRTPSPKPKKRTEIIEISSTESSPSSAIKRMKINDGGADERVKEKLDMQGE
ncbi:hypothetical protein TrRE_jg10077 [Triparma retinervis]|uniref:Uncharacterized protein n=1 Tax=Triparma retinervis TaxID=2557542 RepID=A0A9W6ZHS6_9STRA|nr:hypothetical protein TrRE_jg10077 [Triparma retinervis]